jgi:hypothetical protein
VTLAQGQFEALDPDRTACANALGLGQVRGSFGEEELMAPFLATSSVFMDLSQMVVHFKSLFFSWVPGESKSRRISGGFTTKRLDGSHHVRRGRRMMAPGWAPAALGASAPKRSFLPAIPVICWFTNAVPPIRRLENGETKPIRQGN